MIRPATEFARHARHNSIAHRNLNVALGITPLTLGSRSDIRGALKAIDLLHAIEHYFLKTNPRTTTPSTTSEEWTACSTSSSEGSRAVMQFGYFRSSHPPDLS
jgi:hypothetical protein